MQSQSPQAQGSVPFSSRQFVAGVGVLDLHQVEELFPIRPLFFQRHVAVTDLDPARRAVVEQPGVLHVAQVLALGDRAGAERAALDRLEQRSLLCPVSRVRAPGIAYANSRMPTFGGQASRPLAA